MVQAAGRGYVDDGSVLVAINFGPDVEVAEGRWVETIEWSWRHGDNVTSILFERDSWELVGTVTRIHDFRVVDLAGSDLGTMVFAAPFLALRLAGEEIGSAPESMSFLGTPWRVSKADGGLRASTDLLGPGESLEFVVSISPSGSNALPRAVTASICGFAGRCNVLSRTEFRPMESEEPLARRPAATQLDASWAERDDSGFLPWRMMPADGDGSTFALSEARRRAISLDTRVAAFFDRQPTAWLHEARFDDDNLSGLPYQARWTLTFYGQNETLEFSIAAVPAPAAALGLPMLYDVYGVELGAGEVSGIPLRQGLSMMTVGMAEKWCVGHLPAGSEKSFGFTDLGQSGEYRVGGGALPGVSFSCGNAGFLSPLAWDATTGLRLRSPVDSLS